MRKSTIYKIVVEIVFISILFIISTFAKAQENTEFLSVEHAVEIGISNNLGLKVSKYNAELAELNTGLGAAGMLPTVNATASGNYTIENANLTFIDGSDVVNKGAQTRVINAGLLLDWTIFSGRQLSIQKDLLDLNSETAMLQFKQKTFKLVASILSQYQEIIFYKKYGQILLKNRDYINDLLQLAIKKKEIGTATKLDILQAKTDFLNIVNTYELSQMQQQIAKTQLTLLIEKDVEYNFTVDTSFIEIADKPYGKWAALALKNNYNLMLQEKALSRTSMLIDQNKGALWPQVNLNVGFNYTNLQSGGGFLLKNNSFGPTIGITARYNIFDGGRVQRNIDIAKVQYDIQLTQQEHLVHMTKNDLFLAYQQYSFYKEQIKRYLESINLVKQNITIARKMYKLGKIDQFDLRQVRQQLLEMEKLRLQAQLSLSQSYIELKRLSGTTFF